MDIGKAAILLGLIVCALAWFIRNAERLVKVVLQGQSENRFNDWGKRIRNVVEQVFLHKRLMNRPDIGLAHVLFFYGFLIIQVCAIEIFARGFYTNFSYSFLGPLYAPLMLGQDLLCAGVLAAIGYSTFRRLVIRPKHLMTTYDAWVILGLITGVVGTIYVLGAADIALGERETVKRMMPFESALSMILGGFDHDRIVGIQQFAWWGHILVVLGFLNYLPYSKHLHLLGAIPNIFFARTTRIAALPTPDYDREDIEIFGASEPAHFTWKHLLDTTACTECGRCTSVCPANATGKPLSPMKIIHDMKLAMFAAAAKTADGGAGGGHDDHAGNGHDAHAHASDNGHGHAHGDEEAAVAVIEDIPLIGGRISHDELWACTTCGGCVNQCPVLIEHVDDIIEMRRNLVQMQGEFPEELQRTFTALENEGNPWGVSAASRGDWVEELGVKTLDEGEETPLLYWVGCAGSIDSRAKQTRNAFVDILKEAGVEFTTLGACESCTGDPARRAGNEYLYQTLAKQNIETLNNRKIGRIATACPHCYNTLKNEYPDLGGNYEVVHHTELINELVAGGKIEMKPKAKEKVTLHDPCYLGRWNDKVKEPREALKSVPGTELVEMERSGYNSFCCGAGGARMWLEEHIGVPINKERSREAIETGASTVAVGCPFCMTMITDGVKDHGREADVKVKDIAELVAESMVRKATPEGARA